MKELVYVLLLLVQPLLSYADPNRQELSVSVTHCSAVFMMNGSPTIYYEIAIGNLTHTDYELIRVDVFESRKREIVTAYTKEALKKMVTKRRVEHDLTKGISIKAGERVDIYFQVQFSSLNDSSSIANTITLTYLEEGKTKVKKVGLGNMTPATKRPLSIGAPLSKGIWTAVYDPAWERGHRKVMFWDGEAFHIPGRFAIDFVKMDADGHFSKGNHDEIKNHFGFGAEVLAVADGVVISIADSFPESETISGHPKYGAEKATGNYISIEIAENTYAFYEHLQPGSIKVKPGEKVKKGDVIASLGFTGQSTGPHLHFHIADRNSALGAEGIAFVFERFESLGVYDVFDDFGKKRWSPNSLHNRVRQHERPVPNQVIQFLK